MSSMPTVVGEPERLRFDTTGELSTMYLLSPFVWIDDTGGWRIAVRAVPRSEHKKDKIARVHLGRSGDGLRFELDESPTLAPDFDDDCDGCEDPTVVLHDGVHRAFYSGWNEQHQRGHLLVATADCELSFSKNGRVLPQPSHFVNSKEGSVVRCDDTWHLMFEYAIAGRSAIGMATSLSLGGPWSLRLDPFVRRHGKWDSFHVSPGPVVTSGDERFVFYNGANDKTQWRIGWARLDGYGITIVERGDEPIITPPPVNADETDIAFCSSAVQTNETTWLFYTVSDKDAFRVRIAFA